MHVWSIPSARNSVTDVQDLPIDTPGGEQRPARASRRRGPRTDARTRSSATQQSRRIDVGANVEGRDLDPSSATSRSWSRASSSRPGTTPRCWASPTELNAAQDRLILFGLGAAVVIFLLLQAAFGSLRAGGADVPAAADGARRRGAGREARRRHPVARLAGRLPDRVRHRRPQRHPDDQPLPAPRARGGRALRAGAWCCGVRRSGSRRS